MSISHSAAKRADKGIDNYRLSAVLPSSSSSASGRTGLAYIHENNRKSIWEIELLTNASGWPARLGQHWITREIMTICKWPAGERRLRRRIFYFPARYAGDSFSAVRRRFIAWLSSEFYQWWSIKSLLVTAVVQFPARIRAILIETIRDNLRETSIAFTFGTCVGEARWTCL